MRMWAGLALLAAILLLGAAAQSKRRVEGPFPAKPGEICVICYDVLDTSGLAYLIDGHRYAVGAGESGEFLEDPDAHIQAFQAHQRKKLWMSLAAPGAAIGLTAAAALAVWLFRRKRS